MATPGTMRASVAQAMRAATASFHEVRTMCAAPSDQPQGPRHAEQRDVLRKNCLGEKQRRPETAREDEAARREDWSQERSGDSLQREQ